VPGSDGKLRCLTPADGGITCVAPGGVCTSSSDCCAGQVCTVPPGQNQGTCGAPPVSTGTDGGTKCATSGQQCKGQSDCCTGLNCLAPGGTGMTCAAGQAGCTCTNTIL
jgi:hypothetical protein